MVDNGVRAVQTIQTLMEEQGVVKAFNTLQSQTVRNSLFIPDAIWEKMEPQMKEKVMEIRRELRAKRAAASPVNKAASESNKPRLSAQYPTVTAAASMHMTDLLARVNKMVLDEDSDDASIDDEAITLDDLTIVLKRRAEVIAPVTGAESVEFIEAPSVWVIGKLHAVMPFSKGPC